MENLWGDLGTCYNWSCLHGIQEGSSVNLVCQVAFNERDGDSTYVTVMPCHTPARVKGLILNSGVHEVTLVDAKYHGFQMVHTFEVERDTIVVQHHRVEKSNFLTMLEVCSGMGIATFGFEQVGIQTVIAVEIRKHSSTLSNNCIQELRSSKVIVRVSLPFGPFCPVLSGLVSCSVDFLANPTPVGVLKKGPLTPDQLRCMVS